ncbi:hypothetical protein FOA43_003449 [Brettanomyces nanus]|uniref:Ketoreductase (KR) domain-containing protein n=1 Tax=Eeniella nana TaxID=13502 RepID=A0A875S564_EENNA|nr:uncharacterized protein FOA43_003449 [Brettanomyces nanus]QPG76063.1 hypothetical protein FOA43_003449 [Brettanomyces nanus]
MPLNYLGTLLVDGTDKTPGWFYIKNYGTPLLAAVLAKMYLNGSSNTWQRDLHGKVYIVTGGTSGIGAPLVRELALRGAQLVLLTSQLKSDNSGAVWVTDYVDDLRNSTDNPLIYVEECNLSSLYSVRKFATKWLDNRTARRLDGVICLASERMPIGKSRQVSVDGVEMQMAINYLGQYHLLTLLEPCLKAQPPDRDVRVILATCMSQSIGTLDLDDLLWEVKRYPSGRPWKMYGSSKLMLHMFAKEYQKRLENAGRKDKQPCNIRVNVVNPGITRTPSTRRAISMGSVLGLLVYLLLYPFFWIVLKPCEYGMQSFLYALCCPDLIDISGGQYIRECSVVKTKLRKELQDDELQKNLYDLTARKISELEKKSAIERNRGKPDGNKKKDKRQKKDEMQKKDKKGLTEEDKRGIFMSAFDTEDELQNYKARNANTDDAHSTQLRRLDEKYEATHKKS